MGAGSSVEVPNPLPATEAAAKELGYTDEEIAAYLEVLRRQQALSLWDRLSEDNREVERESTVVVETSKTNVEAASFQLDDEPVPLLVSWPQPRQLLTKDFCAQGAGRSFG